MIEYELAKFVIAFSISLIVSGIIYKVIGARTPFQILMGYLYA